MIQNTGSIEEVRSLEAKITSGKLEKELNDVANIEEDAYEDK